MPDYNAENRLVLTPLAASDSTETYDGQARAASLNQYYADNSPFWKAATAFGNGQGFALKTGQTGIYRFTGGRESTNTFVYEEQGEDKTVTLTQYDRKTSLRTESPTSPTRRTWDGTSSAYLTW